MGFISNMIAEKRSGTTLSSLKQIVPWLENLLGGEPTTSGAPVNSQKAMGVTAVYGCVKIIAWTIASLPLITYRSQPNGGKQRDKNNPIYQLLHDTPNPEQTSFQFRSFLSVMQNLWGAGFAEIEYDARGYIVALWPIPTWCVEPIRTSDTKKLFYRVTVDGQTKILRPENTLVFPALQASPDVWLSPIRQHRETIGAAIAAKEFGARTFGQGTNPAGILSGLKIDSNETEDSLRAKFAEKYAGLGNSHRLMLLEEGTKFERVGLPPEDAQYLETRRFDIAEIARIFSVPLHLLQDTTGTTAWGSGLEELNTAFVSFTMQPYFVEWEQELKRRLLDNTDVFIEFNVDALLRAKLADRYAAYAIGRQWGWLCADDICELENRNPLPDGQGKIYLVPMNMTDARKAGQNATAVAKPAEQQIEDPSAPQPKKGK
jgi:HK97 family phage portal protein